MRAAATAVAVVNFVINLVFILSSGLRSNQTGRRFSPLADKQIVRSGISPKPRRSTPNDKPVLYGLRLGILRAWLAIYAFQIMSATVRFAGMNGSTCSV